MDKIINKKKKGIIPLGVTIGEWEINMPFVRTDITSLDSVFLLIKDLLNIAIGLSVVVAVALIIYSGILFITSAGDPENISTATKTLTAAIVGMIIVFIARMVIVFLLEAFLL